MLDATYFRGANAMVPGAETVVLSDKTGLVLAQSVVAERRPITKSSPFYTLQLDQDDIEFVLHDDGSFPVRSNYKLQATSASGTTEFFLIKTVTTRLLGARHHCLCSRRAS